VKQCKQICVRVRGQERCARVDNVEAEQSQDKARLRAHTGSEDDVLTSILAQVFIYLQLFVPTSIVWYGMISSERRKVL
jgi:hypothetical protein